MDVTCGTFLLVGGKGGRWTSAEVIEKQVFSPSFVFVVSCVFPTHYVPFSPIKIPSLVHSPRMLGSGRNSAN